MAMLCSSSSSRSLDVVFRSEAFWAGLELGVPDERLKPSTIN